jgi:hypothetical protein
LTILFTSLCTSRLCLGAQEITYNLTPTHELGPEVWKIPISGKLTLSADGKRVLVACLADSAFYMVDVETGAYRKLHSQYFQDNTYGSTQYGTDQQCRWLVIHGTDLREGVARQVFRVEDTETGEIVLEQEPGITIRAVSQRQDRLISNNQLIKLSTFELIREYPKDVPGSIGAWFDDDRNLAYRSRPLELQEINTATGDVLRTWTVRASRFWMLRPSNSDWLYVISTETDGLKGGSQNLVEAINLVTGERLTFEKYFWSGADGYPDFTYSYPYFYPTTSTCHARGADGGHLNVVWEFDAAQRLSQCAVDLRFLYFDSPEKRSLVIEPEKTKILSCWNSRDKDSSILRCNALISVATSAQENPEDESSPDVSVIQRDNRLTIELVGTTAEELITNVQVFTSDGIVVASVPVSDPSFPVTVSISHLSSGAYRCVVTTTERELFASFTIVR